MKSLEIRPLEESRPTKKNKEEEEMLRKLVEKARKRREKTEDSNEKVLVPVEIEDDTGNEDLEVPVGPINKEKESEEKPLRDTDEVPLDQTQPLSEDENEKIEETEEELTTENEEESNVGVLAEVEEDGNENKREDEENIDTKIDEALETVKADDASTESKVVQLRQLLSELIPEALEDETDDAEDTSANGEALESIDNQNVEEKEEDKEAKETQKQDISEYPEEEPKTKSVNETNAGRQSNVVASKAPSELTSEVPEDEGKIDEADLVTASVVESKNENSSDTLSKKKDKKEVATSVQKKNISVASKKPSKPAEEQLIDEDPIERKTTKVENDIPVLSSTANTQEKVQPKQNAKEDSKEKISIERKKVNEKKIKKEKPKKNQSESLRVEAPEKTSTPRYSNNEIKRKKSLREQLDELSPLKSYEPEQQPTRNEKSTYKYSPLLDGILLGMFITFILVLVAFLIVNEEARNMVVEFFSSFF